MIAFIFSLLISYSYAGHAVIFNGNNIKALKNNYDLNHAAQILSGTVDPTSVATTAQKGSIYLNTSNSFVYKKNDNGSSTNWSALSTTSGGATVKLLVDGYYAPVSGCVLSRSSATLGPLNGGTLTSCPAFTVESPTVPPFTVSSSSASFPAITLASLPVGIFEVEALVNASAASGTGSYWAISDGTNAYGVDSYDEFTTGSLQKNIRAVFTYASSGSRTFTIYVATQAGAILTTAQPTGVNGGGPIRMTVKQWQ